MCGIAGQMSARKPVDPALIDRMCAAIEHRGPDSRGVHVQDGIGLGIQRLRVIDLHTGDQPVFNEDGSVVVVLNGEIYNFRELRQDLIRRGHRFATEGDTEVIVHLYEEQGSACVHALRGMFAFALWDNRDRSLLLARDRVGKKPLFYSERDGVITFASELQGLLQDRGISRELDHTALDCYYAYQYVPAPMSAFRAVRKLPPATTLTFRDGRASLEQYWQLDYARKQSATHPEDLHEQVRTAIDAAVRRRMIADVPLGAFLSGGIDSSAVVAVMAAASSDPVKTFSIGFEQRAFDELPHARRVAELFGTDHHEFTVEPSAIELLPQIVRHYGEPFADASAIPSFYLAKLTRQHVTVALNGDGGDESFAGYNRYASNALAGRLESFPLPLRRSIGAIAERVPSMGQPRSTWNRGRRLGRSLALTPPERYARHMSYFDTFQRAELYTSAYRAEIDESIAPAVIERPWSKGSGTSVVDRMLETDVHTYLPGDLLVKMDIATMAHSLEARSPLLDHEVMELAASIPAEWKLQRLEKKVILRDALAAWLPRDLLDRPKMGFGVPLADWFRNELRDYVRDVLLDPATTARGYFHRPYVERMLAEHAAAREDHSPRLWSLLVAEMWHRQFVDFPAGLDERPPRGA
jgi:asparagine synthase (glutamine-hydrolysing)